MTDEPLTTLEGEEPVWFERNIGQQRYRVWSNETETVVNPCDIIRRIRALQERVRELEEIVKWKSAWQLADVDLLAESRKQNAELAAALEKAIPFIGYQAHVPDIRNKAEAALKRHKETAS